MAASAGSPLCPPLDQPEPTASETPCCSVSFRKDLQEKHFTLHRRRRTLERSLGFHSRGSLPKALSLPYQPAAAGRPVAPTRRRSPQEGAGAGRLGPPGAPRRAGLQPAGPLPAPPPSQEGCISWPLCGFPRKASVTLDTQHTPLDWLKGTGSAAVVTARLERESEAPWHSWAFAVCWAGAPSEHKGWGEAQRETARPAGRSASGNQSLRRGWGTARGSQDAQTLRRDTANLSTDTEMAGLTSGPEKSREQAAHSSVSLKI